MEMYFYNGTNWVLHMPYNPCTNVTCQPGEKCNPHTGACEKMDVRTSMNADYIDKEYVRQRYQSGRHLESEQGEYIYSITLDRHILKKGDWIGFYCQGKLVTHQIMFDCVTYEGGNYGYQIVSPSLMDWVKVGDRVYTVYEGIGRGTVGQITGFKLDTDAMRGRGEMRKKGYPVPHDLLTKQAVKKLEKETQEEPLWREEDLVPPITAFGYKIPNEKKKKSIGTNDTGPR